MPTLIFDMEEQSHINLLALLQTDNLLLVTTNPGLSASDSAYSNLKTAINKISIDPEKLNQMDLNLNNQTIDFENTSNSFLIKYAQKWMLVLQYLFGF